MCGFIFVNDSSISETVVKKGLVKIKHRGPDDFSFQSINNAYLGFTRLAVMDLSSAANQPFVKGDNFLLCNGEIYNFKKLKKKYSYNYQSTSDCEVLLPMFSQLGFPWMLKQLDGEFAFVIYNEKEDEVVAARDPMGIRPLFYGHTEAGKICFASEVKALQGICKQIEPFPPGCYYQNGEIKKYLDLSEVKNFSKDTHEKIYENINKLLTDAVIKRLNSDAKIGFLLSGGLDSSLVCAIAQKHSKTPIKTFAIGMSGDAIDLKYAKEVAAYIGSDHTEVIIDKKDVLDSLRDVIYTLESFDITTIRASVGMYLVCKYIKEKTDIKVVLTGEVSDEIFGYKYTDFAPNPVEFQREAAKRVKELYIYDVLRADRCISANSLEARVPFSDTAFVKYVMSIDPEKKMNSYGQGKYLLRKAFEGDYLPNSILYREKAAFSDAVGHSLVEYIKEYAAKLYCEKQLQAAKKEFTHGTPFTSESLFYREVFEDFYPGLAKLIADFWMPNRDWENCDVSDPSARVLPNYGASAC